MYARSRAVVSMPDQVVEVERDGIVGAITAIENLLADEAGAAAVSAAMIRAATILTGTPPPPWNPISRGAVCSTAGG